MDFEHDVFAGIFDAILQDETEPNAMQIERLRQDMLDRLEGKRLDPETCKMVGKALNILDIISVVPETEPEH